MALQWDDTATTGPQLIWVWEPCVRVYVRLWSDPLWCPRESWRRYASSVYVSCVTEIPSWSSYAWMVNSCGNGQRRGSRRGIWQRRAASSLAGSLTHLAVFHQSRTTWNPEKERENKERWRPRPRQAPARLPPQTGLYWETVACVVTRRACEASPTTRLLTLSWPLLVAGVSKWLTVLRGRFFKLRHCTVSICAFSPAQTLTFTVVSNRPVTVN